MATQVRNISGEIFDLDTQQGKVISALQEDGVLVICQRSNIAVVMNSLNRVQAREVRGDLGYTTLEFLEKEIFMATAVGKALFLLHDHYTIGISKLLIPIPHYKDPTLRSYNAYVATLFGGLNNAHMTFELSVKTTCGEHRLLTVNGGDILVCTDRIERTIPQTHSGTVFVSETFYYPPHAEAIVRLEEKLANDYILQGGGELERDRDGSVIWLRDRFKERLRE